MNHLEVHNQQSVNAALKSLVTKLDNLINNVNSDVLVESHKNVLLHTKLQAIFNFKPGEAAEQHLLEIILNHAMAAEKLGPGAFDETIRMTLELLKQSGKGFQQSNNQKLETTVSSLATETDVQKLIDGVVSKIDVKVGSILREALNLSGFGGRILIEKSTTPVSSVELTRGYTFETTSAWQLSTRLDDVRAFVIDGYVEQVSEIHHLLQAASDAKETAILFVRGLSNDVLHTLRVNYDRGTLKMVPIIVKFDLDGINTVNDIAIATGCDLISSNKGDLINSIKYESAPRLKSVIVYPNKVVIHHDVTAKSVAVHVANLRKKRTEPSVVDDVGNLYDKRIRSLSPNHVVIRLPDNKDYVRLSQAIDVTLRTIKAMIDHGVINHNGTVMPASTKIAAEVHSSRCHSTLINLGAIIV